MNWRRITTGLAPTALRKPISRRRSPTVSFFSVCPARRPLSIHGTVGEASPVILKTD
jgi:hypothetical protein